MRWAGVLLLAVLIAGCSRGAQQDALDDGIDPGPPGIPYQVIVAGEMPEDVRNFMLSASQAAQQVDRPPSSDLVLRRRAEGDLAQLRTALRAQGYYEGTLTYRIDRPVSDEGLSSEISKLARDVETLVEGPQTRIVYELETGPRFTFAKRDLVTKGGTSAYAPPRLAWLGIKQGEPAIAQTVIDAERALIRNAQENGLAFAKVEDRHIVVDYDHKTMDVELSVDLGAPIRFAEPTFGGIDDIDAAFVRGRIPYAADDLFDPRKLERAKARLLDAELFSTVLISQATTLDSEGRLPVHYEMTQRKHRTIGAGVGYLSGDGPNARVFWKHRNLFGGGESLNVEANGSVSVQQVVAAFRKRDFHMTDLALIADGNIKNEDTDAYSSRSIGAGVGLERSFNKHVTGSLGVAYRFAEVKEPDSPEDIVGLFSIPARLDLDYSNNLLDPSEGWRLDLTGAPYVDTLGIGTYFLKTRATTTRYFQLTKDPRLVVAARASVGSIVGADRADIPADERFYAGGGGSVRGIPYQLAGPLVDGEPSGGRSILEGSGEIRWRAFESVELVAFVDAGSVFETVVPTVASNLEIGTGVGFRYVTPVGPFRFDVAVPVQRRKGIDDAYQFYVSIGQAF